MSSALAKTVAYMIFAVLLILFLNIMSYRETKKYIKTKAVQNILSVCLRY